MEHCRVCTIQTNKKYFTVTFMTPKGLIRSSCSNDTLSSLPSIVPRLFYSLNNDKQALVVSAAQSQISKSLQVLIYLFLLLSSDFKS